MKRCWSVLLALLLLLPCLNEGTAETAGAQQPITVGITTQMSGNFYSDMWGNNTVDADIRALLHGYDTIVWKNAGEYGVNDNVVTALSTVDGNGQRIYTVTLAADLIYNDGTAITAADYVFAILLQSDPCIPLLGGMNTNYAHLTGWTDYASGASAVFSGVRLLSDTQFSVAVPDSALPYFYELTYLSAAPCPIAVVAPGYAVRDDGAGAYLAKQDDTGAWAATALTTDLLGETLTGEEGYLHQPKVTCGPYQLEQYDAAGSTASFTINPRYKGNFEGRKPEVQQVKVVQMASEDAVAAFQNGELQILHKLSDGTAIAAANALAAKGEATVTNYLRSGYAFLAFACEQAPTDDVLVRQAIAQCIDRDALVNTVYAGYGLTVSGYYGYGQWMAAQHMDALTQFDIGYDVNAARTLLEQAGYIYNAQGGTFTEGADEVRCKVTDGVLTPLTLSWAKAKSAAADALEAQLTPVLTSLGVKLTVHEMTFAELLREYYREDGTRSDQLYFLADNFFHVFDPYYTYNTGDVWQGVFNTSGLRDTALMETADAMRRVSGSDTETYYQEWLLFQARWHEVMPTAPLYSNVYFDVCIPTLYEYNPSAQFGFGSALLYATFTEPVQETALTTDETEAGDPAEEVILD